MSSLKKLTVFLIVWGIILGFGLVTDNRFPVNGATAPPVSTPASLPLTLQFYNGNLAPVTNIIVMNYRIINSGRTALNLSDIKVRYWYTSDGNEPDSLYIYYSPIGVSYITAAIYRMIIPKVGADHYAEIGFSSGAGSLAPGSSIDITAAIAKADWTHLIQTNDYSFNSTATTYVNWTKVTGYLSGTLQWGTEP
jgi:hypothetical protein